MSSVRRSQPPRVPSTVAERASVRGLPVHPALEEAFAALDAAGVKWCVLRGEKDLERPQGDVDLLASSVDHHRAQALLEARGFARLHAYGRGSHSFFLNYHVRTDQWIKLDFVTELSYGPFFSLKTHAEEACLRRRRREGKLVVLHPDDSFWALFLHCLLDKRRFEPHHAARLQELAPLAVPDGPLGPVVARATPAEWSPGFIIELVRRGEWPALKTLARSLTWRWVRAQPWRVGREVAASSVLRAVEKLVVSLDRRGMNAALLGPDGTGKSTIARKVAESFYFPATTVYMGLWKGDDELPMLHWRSWLRILVRPATIWRRYLRARAHQLLGRLVIFDRYPYDAHLPPRPPLVRTKKLYFWLLAHTCPAPNLVFLLDAPGHVIASRKGEDTPEELEWQRRHFLRLRRRIPGLAVVDATRSEAEVKAEIVKRIWQPYVARGRRTLS